MSEVPEGVRDPRRLEALAEARLLDTPAEEAFDRLTRLATALLHAPVALVSLVDADRQFFKSAQGLAEPWATLRQTPLSHSFCQHVVGTGEALVVRDAREDPRLAGNLAIPELGVIAYVGVPLKTGGGEVLGSFCAIDTVPREWTDEELSVVRDLAAATLTEIELRGRVRELEASAEALRQSEARYRALVESASDIIYQTDAGGVFTYVNPVAARIMGRPAETLVGLHFTELIRPDAREAALAFYRRQLQERRESTYYEFPAMAGDGREVWIGQNVRLLTEGGEVTGTQAVARDMTARREIERMKAEFVSVVSHEMQTPLTALRGSLGLLASQRMGDLGEQGKRMVTIAVQNADRLIRLITDVLDIERLESGAAVLERQPCDAAALVDAAVAEARRLAGAASPALSVDAEPAPLSADPARVTQVLVNLVSNAVKFSPAGAPVRVSARRDGRVVRFQVADQGRGIPPAQLETVFDRFRQGDMSDDRQQGGTGLGLAIAREIVELHGGRIGVESRVGEGSTFWFTLPAASESDSHPA